MPERLDPAALLAGQAAVIDVIGSGGSRLPALTRMLEGVDPAIGAAGTAFVEFTPAGGRIVAATGDADWAVGRPVSPTDPATACLLSGPRVREVDVNCLPGPLGDELAGRGLRRMVVARAEIGGRTVGSLHAFHADPDAPDRPGRRNVVAYVASCIAHLYGDQAGLPAPGPGAQRVVTFRESAEQQPRDDDDLFVAVTSHALRTPITVIKGYADTLTDHWASLTEADRREAARVIGQRANELARLVDRLLTSAAEGQPVEQAAPFDLGDALRSAVADLPADLRRRIVLDLPADLPRALGNRLSLAAVLTELGTNADKHSPPDSPIRITASATRRYVSFRVSDRGIGIWPEHVERAFDRFWQGETGGRPGYPGAGLGLYLVRRIVEQQNGWVSLRPRPGGGTVAEVRLPRR